MQSERSACFVCRKHRAEIQLPGGSIFEDELIFCGHAWSQENDEGIYQGACIVEPKRHVTSWADLSDAEAACLGLAVRDIGRALTALEGAEHVYVFVLGHHVPHLHVWVIPRYPATPREYWGLQLFEWPQRPKGSAVAVAELCDRLRRELSRSRSGS